ncbi:hypothetical protein D3C87_2027560 [compost metagenome]
MLQHRGVDLQRHHLLHLGRGAALDGGGGLFLGRLEQGFGGFHGIDRSARRAGHEIVFLIRFVSVGANSP